MIDIHMFYVNVDTARFTTSCGFQEDAPKPVLVHTELITFDIAFRHENGTPFDLTGASLTAAWDNNFIHTDSLAASTSDVDIIDAEGGIARFHVQCSSDKFAQLVYSRPTTVKMQVVYYSLEDLGGNSILRDCGVTLCPRVATTEGMPEQDDPDYYNKVQVDALLETKVGVAEDMPEASAEYLGSVVVYSGETGEYTTGHSYKCIQSSDQYMWQDITPAGGSSKDSVIHSDELPEASEDVLGDVYLYTGSTAPYEYGQKYICVQTNLGYIWSRMTERVNSVNNKTGDIVIDATDVGAIASPVGGNSGEYLKKTAEGAVWSEISNNWPVVQLSTESFTPKSATIYEYTVQEGDEITFGTPIGSGAVVFEYRITVPDPVPAFTFGNTLTWLMNSAAQVATPGTHRLRITYIGGAWEVYLPDLSQYALAADYVPKTGGTFTGNVTIAPPANFSGKLFAVNDSTYGEMFFVDRWNIGCGQWTFAVGFYGGMAIGRDVVVSGGYGCAAIGETLRNAVSRSTIVGSFGTMPADAKFAVANGSSSSQKHICFSVLNTGDVVSTNSIVSAGSLIRQLSEESGVVSISPQQGIIYEYTLVGGETITFVQPSHQYAVTFELRITMPNPAVSFTFGNTLTWLMNSASLVATPGTHRLKITYIPPVDESNSGSGEPTGTWEVYLPDLSQYAQLNGGNVFAGNQTFNVSDFRVNSNSVGSTNYAIYLGRSNCHLALSIEQARLKATYFLDLVGGQTNITAERGVRISSGSKWFDGEIVLDHDWGDESIHVNHHLIASGSVQSAGSKISPLSSVTDIQPKQGVVYTYTLSGGEEITLVTPASGYLPTIELWLTQPSTAVSFSLGTTVLWNDGSGNFSSGNQAPAVDTGNRTYCMVFRWTGSVWLCNLAYTVEVGA